MLRPEGSARTRGIEELASLALTPMKALYRGEIVGQFFLSHPRDHNYVQILGLDPFLG